MDIFSEETRSIRESSELPLQKLAQAIYRDLFQQ